MEKPSLDDPVAWGQALILSQDHDPLYFGLWGWGQEVGPDRVRRFMLAYWCCYSVGAAWWISQHEGLSFWRWMHTAAENAIGPAQVGAVDLERWPRAAERRHWRGQKCVDSVTWFTRTFPAPESALGKLEAECRSLEDVGRVLRDWPLFGPWITFKAADMLERVLGVPVAFPLDVAAQYREPRAGAELMMPLLGFRVPQQVADHLMAEYSTTGAPPSRDRPCGIQEVETVLCKWKSARGGHYHLGKDIDAHRRELELWGAHDLLANYPCLPEGWARG